MQEVMFSVDVCIAWLDWLVRFHPFSYHNAFWKKQAVDFIDQFKRYENLDAKADFSKFCKTLFILSFHAFNNSPIRGVNRNYDSSGSVIKLLMLLINNPNPQNLHHRLRL